VQSQASLQYENTEPQTKQLLQHAHLW